MKIAAARPYCKVAVERHLYRVVSAACPPAQVDVQIHIVPAMPHLSFYFALHTGRHPLQVDAVLRQVSTEAGPILFAAFAAFAAFATLTVPLYAPHRYLGTGHFYRELVVIVLSTY